MERSYKNVNYLFTVILAFIIIAFFRTYFGKFPSFEGTAPLIHFHVAMVLLWFTMLIMQPILIRINRIEAHRLAGKASYIFVPLLVFSFALMTRSEQLREKNLGIFTVNIFDVSLFVIFYTLAIIYKKKDFLAHSFHSTNSATVYQSLVRAFAAAGTCYPTCHYFGFTYF